MIKSIIKSFGEMKSGGKAAVIIMCWLWVPILLVVFALASIIFVFKVGVVEWIGKVTDNLNVKKHLKDNDTPYGST